MPKADADRAEHKRGRSRPGDADGSNDVRNVRPAGAADAATTPDDIPAVHILEAAQNQERKEAEELLAGFDRPGRGPKRRSPSRDFIDYYARKSDRESSRPDTSSPSGDERPRETKRQSSSDGDFARGVPKRLALPAWMGWGLASVIMVGLGGAVAFVATTDEPSTRARGSLTADTNMPTSGAGVAGSARLESVPVPPPGTGAIAPPAIAPPATTALPGTTGTNGTASSKALDATPLPNSTAASAANAATTTATSASKAIARPSSPKTTTPKTTTSSNAAEPIAPAPTARSDFARTL